MLSEQITVTTTATSIFELLVAARGATTPSNPIPTKCTGIKLRYDSAESNTVTLSDSNSSTGAVVLDASGESLVNVSFAQFSLTKALLKSSSGNVTVHLVVEQNLV